MQLRRYFSDSCFSIRAYLPSLALLFAIPSRAVEFLPATRPLPSFQPQSALGSFLRVGGSVIFVIALFLGAIWLFKNWRRMTVHGGPVENLRVLEVKSLGPRNAVYVIGYQRERLLLSSGPTGVAFVAHLPEADPSESVHAPATISFGQALVQALSHKA